MEENGGGGLWGSMGGKWGNSGHSTRDVGCGGLWWDVVAENGTKMGEKWGGRWDEIPPLFSTVPFLPFFRRSKIFSKTPKFTALTNRKMGFFCHSPTLTTTAASADAWG